MAGVSTNEDATDQRRRLAEGRGRGVGELPRLERARAEEEQEQAYDEAYADRRLERARAREQQEQAHAEGYAEGRGRRGRREGEMRMHGARAAQAIGERRVWRGTRRSRPEIGRAHV